MCGKHNYLVSWVGGCGRFVPCDVAPSHFARYRFTVKHPQGTDVLCPGTISRAETQTICDFDHDGGPSYSTFGVAASPSWVASDLGDWSGVRATLYDTPSSGIAQALDVDAARGFFQWMASTMGPYPYGDELRFAVGPTYWNGFEHPGNIVLSDSLARPTMSAYTSPLTHTTIHEIAHQWAGDQTTLASTYDFVWKEAMVEYLSFVYEEESIGVSVGLATARAWKQFSRNVAFYPVPGEQPQLLDYYGDVYGPGPMILFRQIEALFDRTIVMSALSSLLGVQRAISVADVKAALEDATGADLSNYFDAWVYGTGAPSWPVYEVSVRDLGAGEAEITLSLVDQSKGPLGSAFGVALLGADNQSHQIWIDLGVDGALTHTQRATPGFAVTGYTFDPGAHTLARAVTASTANAPPRRHPWLAPERPVPYPTPR